jgi:hypothetical protein
LAAVIEMVEIFQVSLLIRDHETSGAKIFSYLIEETVEPMFELCLHCGDSILILQIQNHYFQSCSVVELPLPVFEWEAEF